MEKGIERIVMQAHAQSIVRAAWEEFVSPHDCCWQFDRSIMLHLRNYLLAWHRRRPQLGDQLAEVVRECEELIASRSRTDSMSRPPSADLFELLKSPEAWDFFYPSPPSSNDDRVLLHFPKCLPFLGLKVV